MKIEIPMIDQYMLAGLAQSWERDQDEFPFFIELRKTKEGEFILVGNELPHPPNHTGDETIASGRLNFLAASDQLKAQVLLWEGDSPEVRNTICDMFADRENHLFWYAVSFET